eukprot:gene14137-15614_t
MKKKQKIGKARRDKYYHLAKETGYRARSAFKLIQLNRKFNFLQKSRVVIDLCAAPGGWLQVAAKFMPMSSLIVGVDLVPIKSIKNVTTIVDDITTESCRQNLKKELKTWKADCVFNDGAPNVGSAWVQDAFSQAQLTLSALKLASEFLKKGGYFITKVFRSKDYAALLVTFQALFTKVHATKPQASRNESAEIFVVCQGYLAPAKVDPKLLDLKYVFKEVEEENKRKIDIFKPEKHKRQRDGYAEGNYLLFTTNKVSDFVACENPIEMLSATNQLLFDAADDDKYINHPLTTEEIKTCLNDIKVLGKKELKGILTWRRKLRKEEKDAKQQAEVDEKEADEEPEKEAEETEESLDKMIEDLKENEARELKKKKKKARENKMKLSERIGKKAAGTIESSLEADLFSIKDIHSKKHLGRVDEEGMDQEAGYKEDDDTDEALEFESEDESDADSDEENNDLYDDSMYGSKRPSMDEESILLSEEQTKAMLKLRKNKKSSKDEDNPLLMDINKDDEVPKKAKTSVWFKKDAFKNLEDDNDEEEDYDIEQLMKDLKKKGTKIVGEEDQNDKNIEESVAKKKNSDAGEGMLSKKKKRKVTFVDRRKKSEPQKKAKQGFEVVPQGTQVVKFLTPEALALGEAMVTSRKRKRDIIDESFNRYSFGPENLPSWFEDEEKKHTLTQLPITKEEVNYYKEKLKEINARPMKKLFEAKARKKQKMLRKLEKVRRKADNVLGATDVSENEKMNQVKSMYKKAGLLSKKKIEKKYVVAKKSLAGKRYPRPSGVKGIYRVVDPRMKKDLRAMKQKEKTVNRGKKGKKRKAR